jgi:hypothetical protein
MIASSRCRGGAAGIGAGSGTGEWCRGASMADVSLLATACFLRNGGHGTMLALACCLAVDAGGRGAFIQRPRPWRAPGWLPGLYDDVGCSVAYGARSRLSRGGRGERERWPFEAAASREGLLGAAPLWTGTEAADGAQQGARGLATC